MFIHTLPAYHRLGSHAWESTVFGESADAGAFLRVSKSPVPAECLKPLGILTIPAGGNSTILQIFI